MTAPLKRGKLFYENGPTIVIDDCSCGFFEDNFVNYAILADGSLQICSRRTNELELYKKFISEDEKERLCCRAEVKSLKQQLSALLTQIESGDIENTDEGELERLGWNENNFLCRNIYSLSLHHSLVKANGIAKKRLRELENKFETHIKVEENKINAILRPGVVTRVPFATRDTSVVWCLSDTVASPSIVEVHFFMLSLALLHICSWKETTELDVTRLVGDGYMYGLGVARDKKAALHMYKLAQDSSPIALAHCLQNGEGCLQDEKKAAALLHSEALEGNSYAQNNLGHCFRNGLGVERNTQEAVLWYRRAAALGNSNAQASPHIAIYDLFFIYLMISICALSYMFRHAVVE
jgi:hypothetical protein